MNFIGNFPNAFTTVPIMFTTADANGQAVAPSAAFVAGDVNIYKDGGATQKTTTNGLAMTSPFDSITGLHLLLIDTSNNTGDTGFWASGHVYNVILTPATTTVAGQTIVKEIGSFTLDAAVSVASVTGAVGSVTGAVGSVTGAVGSVTAGVTLAAAAVQAIWDALTSALTTVGSIGKRLADDIDATISSRTKPADTQAAVTLVTTTTNLTNAPTSGDFTSTMKTSLNAATPALSAAGVQAIWDALTSALTTVGSVGKRIADNLDAAVTSRTKPADTQAAVTLVTTTTNVTNDVGITQTAADKVWASVTRLLTAGTNIVLAKGVGVTGFNDLDAAGVRTAVGLASANLDTQLAEIEGETDDIAAIKAKTDNLPADPASESLVISALSAVDADVLAVKSKTDSLTFSVSGQADVNVQYVNDTQVIGDGHSGTEWGPA